MSKLSSAKKLQVTLVCSTAVSKMFAEFHNPEIAGRSFKWENFPNMCKELSSTWLIISDLITKRHTKKEVEELKELASDYTYKFATSLCEVAGYV